MKQCEAIMLKFNIPKDTLSEITNTENFISVSCCNDMVTVKSSRTFELIIELKGKEKKLKCNKGLNSFNVN